MNYSFVLGFVSGAFVITLLYISSLRNDIERIDVKLKKIAKHVGEPNLLACEMNDLILDEIRSLLLEGKKIKAIKKYRKVTGTGLLEAKEFIDSLN